MEYKLNIVLIEPEIPQNTGNIARTCAATGAKLHLVGPMGFVITNKHLKRAGLDYWDKLDIVYYDSTKDFFERNRGEKFYFFSTKGKIIHSDMKYENNAFLVFGKETKGLDEKLLKDNYDSCVRLPMRGMIRSLNLSNTVCTATYEVLRQWGYPELSTEGKLTKF